MMRVRVFSWIGLMLVFGILVRPAVAAVDTTALRNVPAAEAAVTSTFKSFNRVNGDTVYEVTVMNASAQGFKAPVYLMLEGLSGAGVTVKNASGVTVQGAPFYLLSTTDVAAGARLVQTVLLSNPANVRLSFTPVVYATPAAPPAPTPLVIRITKPATLITVGSTPLAIEGTVSSDDVQLTVNGAPISVSGGRFQASVTLEEGHNTIIARAVKGGQESTATIAVSLDLSPPYITVETPPNNSVVTSKFVAVSGLINDIVRGTVSEGQANVVVNGKSAQVANRTYLVENVELVEGSNTITVRGADQVGNTTTVQTKVTYKVPGAKHIELVSGQSQRARIRANVAQPLRVKLFDELGNPAVNKPVVFRVIEGDGAVGVGGSDAGPAVLVQTDANGVAGTTLKLGSRAGNGNNHVTARAVGFEGMVEFIASADPNPGDKVSVNSGNTQRGAAGQPLPLPFVVVVTDDGANVLKGSQIEFKVTQGSGEFQNGSPTLIATTDSDGRATATLTLGSETGLDAQRVIATLVGTSLTAGFTASALTVGEPGQTSISGVVLDNQDRPLPNVTIRVDGTTREAKTDAQGQFKVTQVPVGPVHLIADGGTTTVPGEWPTLPYNVVTIAGADNPLPAPVYMVKLDTDNAVFVGREDQTLTLKDLPGFALTVPKGSITFPNGDREGYLSVTQVNASKIPMSPPNGMQPQLIVTIQPTGARFDPPAPFQLPNVDGHAPGAQVEMYSFDHDLEEFVAIGLGTVSADGTVIKSNVGVGVIKAGWHCGSQPAGGGCAHNCPVCQDCNPQCVCRPKDEDPRIQSLEVTGDCKKPVCMNGSPSSAPDVADKPDPAKDPANTCKTCDSSGTVVADKGKDGTAIPMEKCKVCFDGAPAEVTVSVSGVPPVLCVDETRTISASLKPMIPAFTGPSFQTPGELSATSDGNNSTAKLKGLRGNSEKVRFKSYFGSAPGVCSTVESELLVLPKNVENIPGKMNRFTEFDFMVASCPAYPRQDTSRLHEIDGCSGGIAQDPTNFGGLFIPYITGSQRFNRGRSTAFGAPQGSIANSDVGSRLLPLPCNKHDICYQTCGNTQAACDASILTDMNAVCNSVYPAACPAEFSTQCVEYFEERNLCLSLARDVLTGLTAAGSPAWTQRQTQYCLCCQP